MSYLKKKSDQGGIESAHTLSTKFVMIPRRNQTKVGLKVIINSKMCDAMP